jgi:tetratricopeptide (TPR) repeat protein
MNRFILLRVCFFLICSIGMAQTPKRPESSQLSWRILEKANVAFDADDYGTALKLADTAKYNRSAEIKWESYVLGRALTPAAVRRAGDSFDAVLTVLRDRDETTAIELISSYQKRFGTAYFDNSIAKMVSWIKSRTVYPEADYLIGRIYRIEGEYDLAASFYEQARLNSAYLDVPDERYDILYAIADLAYDKNDMKSYESSLLLIIASDPSYTDHAYLNALMRTIRSPQRGSVDKFFILFRSDSDYAIKALFQISSFYQLHGKEDDALQCEALGVVHAVTHILATIRERDPLYQYTNIESFLKKTGSYDDIVSWGQENKIWELFVTFADSCNRSGNSSFALQLFTVLSTSLPDPYWKQVSANRLNESAQYASPIPK